MQIYISNNGYSSKSKDVNIGPKGRGLNMRIVFDQIWHSLGEISELVGIGSGHTYEELRKVLMEKDALPGMVDIWVINELLGRLLRMILSGKDGVVFGFD